MEIEPILAQRLGLTWHVSPLRRKLQKLSEDYPSPGAESLEDWLVDVANARGARIVERPGGAGREFCAPSLEMLSQEALVVGLLLLDSRDRPQMLRLAAQLISRQAVALRPLLLRIARERVGIVAAELSRQAIRAEPDHPLWKELHTSLRRQPAPRSPILHWTRLAEPVMKGGRVNAESWKLVR